MGEVSSDRIMIVDDDASVRRLLDAALSAKGYQVVQAESGEQAIAQAVADPPALIVLDITMPGMDGFETCQRLKSHERLANVPIIFASATSDPEVRVWAFAKGANDYVSKPLHMDEMLARVRVQLELRRSEAALRDRNRQLEQLTSELSQLSRVDPLTRVANRRAWMEALAKEHDRFQRHGNTYSVVVLDIDCFKAFNDSLGHLAGDDCLRRVAAAIGSMCRKVDSVGRYGGEEFVVLLPETDIESAAAVAERIRRAIWSLAIPHPASVAAVRVTASVGVAAARPGLDGEDVLKHADDAMYVAKRAGRNMVYSDFGTPRQEARHTVSKSAMEDLIQVADRMEAARVLIICGDSAKCDAMMEQLDQFGLDVHAAVNIDVAERVHVALDPAVVIYRVSEYEDPFEALRRLRAPTAFANAAVIIAGKLTDQQEVWSLIEAGADDCLAEPFDPIGLGLRVRAVCMHRREREDLLASYQMRGDQMRILTDIVELCRAITGDWCLDTILQQAADTLATIALSRRVEVLLYDAEREVFELAASTADDAPGTGPGEVSDTNLVSEAFGSESTVVVNRAEDSLANGEIMPPVLATPLVSSGECLGVVRIGERCNHLPFSAYELEFIELVAGIAAAAMQNARSIQAELQASDAIMVALARLAEQRDQSTGRHLERVARYCHILASRLARTDKYRETIDAAFLHDLRRAAPLHDIGKVGVPDQVLLHPGKLSDEQLEAIRTHVVLGAETLDLVVRSAPGVSYLKMAADIARYHHEHWDGSGYSAGLAGEDIPLAARITAVADVYDALTTKRVYKPEMTHRQVAEAIRAGRGRQFDPEVVDAFVDSLADFENAAAELADERQDDQPATANVRTPRHEVASVPTDPR